MINSPAEALSLLKKLGAPKTLIRHLELVGEAADELIHELINLNVPFDQNLVRLGVAVHDAGKILFPEELKGKGCEHEPAGERLLLQYGVRSEVARCCLSHARYDEMVVSFEELLVALSDKLWKGKRLAELELQIIDNVATLLGKDRWDIFEKLDTVFEKIASTGDERLERSRIY